MNDFEPEGRFDRIVSVEMFEHLRNHSLFLSRVARWMRPEGSLFVHLFTHRARPYLFEDNGPQDWMSRHFFTGGMMPHDGLLSRCQENLTLQREWRWNGRHYERTCDEWLKRCDAAGDGLLRILEAAYGTDARLWRQRWRIFFMACAELFGYRNGEEWRVSHFLFKKKPGHEDDR